MDREDVLWIGTDSGLIQWQGRILRTLQAMDGLFDDQTWPLHQDPEGDLWVRGWRGLVRIDRETGDVEPAPGMLADAVVNAIFEDRDGRLWIGAHGALFALDPASRLSTYPITQAGEEEVEAITQDREGHLWFGVSGGRAGLHRLSPQRVTMLARENGLPCDNVATVTQGPDGTVWVGLLCRGGAAGLVALRDGLAIPYQGRAGTAPAQVASLLALPEGDLWMGTFGDELFHLEDGRFTRYTHADGLVGQYVVALYRDHQGALWVGARGGLSRYHEGRWITFTTRDGLAHNDVRSIAPDPEGALWIGTNGGVSRYTGGKFTNFTRADGVPAGPVRAIHVDADGTAWIGTYGGGLARLKDREITRFGTQGHVGLPARSGERHVDREVRQRSRPADRRLHHRVHLRGHQHRQRHLVEHHDHRSAGWAVAHLLPRDDARAGCGDDLHGHLHRDPTGRRRRGRPEHRHRHRPDSRRGSAGDRHGHDAVPARAPGAGRAAAGDRAARGVAVAELPVGAAPCPRMSGKARRRPQGCAGPSRPVRKAMGEGTAGEGRLGAHLLLEGWGAPGAVLNDPLRVRVALQAAVAAGRLTLVRLVLEQFTPQGVTGIALLAESHLAIHTWPERGLFAADLFHCGTLEAVEVARELAARLDAPFWNHRVVERVAAPAEAARLEGLATQPEPGPHLPAIGSGVTSSASRARPGV